MRIKIYSGSGVDILIMSVLLLSSPAPVSGKTYDFIFAQVKYNDKWNPYPGFSATIISSIKKYTSIDIGPEKIVLEINDKELFEYPFIYMAGCSGFPVFGKKEITALRNYLIYGGFLFVDNCSGVAGLDFDKGFRREIAKVFPEFNIKRLLNDHAVYRSFFLLKSIGGRRLARPYLEGITIGDWTPVIYSQNDFGGAWVKDRFGRFKFACEPGGERQRDMAIRTGVNIILYSLTVNYKKDQVHIPFILKRRR